MPKKKQGPHQPSLENRLPGATKQGLDISKVHKMCKPGQVASEEDFKRLSDWCGKNGQEFSTPRLEMLARLSAGQGIPSQVDLDRLSTWADKEGNQHAMQRLNALAKLHHGKVPGQEELDRLSNWCGNFGTGSSEALEKIGSICYHDGVPDGLERLWVWCSHFGSNALEALKTISHGRYGMGVPVEGDLKRLWDHCSEAVNPLRELQATVRMCGNKIPTKEDLKDSLEWCEKLCGTKSLSDLDILASVYRGTGGQNDAELRETFQTLQNHPEVRASLYPKQKARETNLNGAPPSRPSFAAQPDESFEACAATYGFFPFPKRYQRVGGPVECGIPQSPLMRSIQPFPHGVLSSGQPLSITPDRRPSPPLSQGLAACSMDIMSFWRFEAGPRSGQALEEQPQLSPKAVLP